MKVWPVLGITLLGSIIRPLAYDQLRSSITLGPTLHYQFGNTKGSLAFGFEISYWVEPVTYPSAEPTTSPIKQGTYRSDLPWSYGIDLGFEASRSVFRFYTEPEIGPIYFGLGIGPVFEINRENVDIRFGAQSTLWAAAFGGIDLRCSAFRSGPILSAGSFAKLPIPLYRLDI